ncbi:MAG: phosphatidylinositol mannoside acyltransferase [Acidimicrobiales bacterium]|nr:MAG: phosphatidylinositol mannoside acyltransferase [Acidimicrobiales bacterium]
MKPAFETAAYTAGWRAVRALPEPVARAVFQRGADAVLRRNGQAVQRLRANLARVLPTNITPIELSAAVQAGVRSYARYWMEAFRLPTWSPQRVRENFVFDNPELLFQAYAQGRGVICVLHHSGNWDHAGAWASASGMPVVTVAERLKPEALYRRFVRYREELGMEILPASGGAQAPLDVMTRRLEEGRIVVLLADRDLSRRAIDVTFFGHPARMPGGPALLALRTGAPLLVVSLWFDGKLCRGRLNPAIPIPSSGDSRSKISVITQRMADGFAAGIAEHPQDWHMMQRLWLDHKAAATSQPTPSFPSKS